MSRRNFEAGLGVAICLVALGVFFWGIPSWVEANDFTAVSPALMPRAAVGLLALLGGLMTVHRLFLERDRTTPMGIDPRMIGLVGVVIVLFGVAVVLMLSAGYLAGGAFIVAVLMYFMGARRWPMILAVAVAAPAILYSVFDKLLGVPLP